MKKQPNQSPKKRKSSVYLKPGVPHSLAPGIKVTEAYIEGNPRAVAIIDSWKLRSDSKSGPFITYVDKLPE
jgi:hypothetical protein